MVKAFIGSKWVEAWTQKMNVITLHYIIHINQTSSIKLGENIIENPPTPLLPL
jgi:hypothetical protein